MFDLSSTDFVFEVGAEIQEQDLGVFKRRIKFALLSPCEVHKIDFSGVEEIQDEKLLILYDYFKQLEKHEKSHLIINASASMQERVRKGNLLMKLNFAA